MKRMRRLGVLGVLLVTALGALRCGGSAPPPVPTLPPLTTTTPQGPSAKSGNAAAAPLQPPAPQQPVPTPQPPPWPTFTPGPKPTSAHRLLYVTAGRLWTANVDGSDRQPLKLDPPSPRLLTPFKDPGRAWLGPHGQRLVYFAGKTAELWVADLSTGHNVRLAERMLPPGLDRKQQVATGRTLLDQKMAWTADGQRVALLGAPDNYDLFVVDLTTNTLTRITEDDRQEGDFVWSPDGRYLAFTAFDNTFGTTGLSAWDSVAGRVMGFPLDPVAEAAGLSPTLPMSFDRGLTFLDEHRFIFYPVSRNGSVGIWLADVTDESLTPVITDALSDVAWSPEAKAWVYVRRDEPGKLWLLRLGDSEPKLLTDDQAYAPVWSPDGHAVLYSRSDPNTTGWDLRVLNLDTGETQVLATNVRLIQQAPPEPGPSGKRFWAPDGSLVIYSTVGRDYGRAEEFGIRGVEAGPDLENWWMATPGRAQPWQATDLQKVFYLQPPSLSPDGQVWAFVGFSYVDLTQHLWTMPREGGHPTKIDSPVRWFRWLP